MNAPNNTQDAMAAFSPATDYALIGRCDTCGNITAVDLDGTPKHEREMQMPGRTVLRVTKAEAEAAWKTARRCDHNALVAELRAKLSQHNQRALRIRRKKSMNTNETTPPDSQQQMGMPRRAIEIANAARTPVLKAGLHSLAVWCQSRATGRHDDETTLTMLELKATELRHRVNRAGWKAVADAMDAKRHTE